MPPMDAMSIRGRSTGAQLRARRAAVVVVVQLPLGRTLRLASSVPGDEAAPAMAGARDPEPAVGRAETEMSTGFRSSNQSRRARPRAYLYATQALAGPARWINPVRVKPASVHQRVKSAPVKSKASPNSIQHVERHHQSEYHPAERASHSLPATVSGCYSPSRRGRVTASSTGASIGCGSSSNN